LILVLALVYPAVIALLFYLAFLRPVQQENSRARREIADLDVGDTVLTQGGLIGVVKDIVVSDELGHTELILDLGGGTEVRALPAAVVRRLELKKPSLAGEGVTVRDAS